MYMYITTCYWSKNYLENIILLIASNVLSKFYSNIIIMITTTAYYKFNSPKVSFEVLLASSAVSLSFLAI